MVLWPFATVDEFLRRLCDPIPPVTAVLYYRWLAAGLHDNKITGGRGVTESLWEFVTHLLHSRCKECLGSLE